MQSLNRNRAVLLVLGMALFAAAIAAPLVWLQAIAGNEYRGKAARQQQQTVEIAGRRGAILDRRGREFAVSVTTESLYVHPKHLENPSQVARSLAPVLGIPASRLEQNRARRRNHKLGKWVVSDRRLSAFNTCTKCNMWVQVEVNPLPNGIDVGGSAVAMNCTGAQRPEALRFVLWSPTSKNRIDDVFEYDIDLNERNALENVFRKFARFAARCKIYPVRDGVPYKSMSVELVTYPSGISSTQPPASK